MNYLLNLALGFIQNPLVRSIVKNVVNLLMTHATDLVPVAVEEIKAAAYNPELKDAQAKYEAVFAALVARFPEVGASVIDTIIETSYNYLKTSKSI